MAEKANLLHVFSPSFSFKNTNNIVFETSLNLFVGHKALQNNTIGLINSELDIPISIDGLLQETNIRFQGFSASMSVGKLFKMSNYNKNSGLYGEFGLGFIQHKLKFDYEGTGVSQLEDPYVKGYDRLTNGLLISQFIGYRRYSNKNSFNYKFGIEINEGLTKNRRSWNYDAFGPITDSRIDFYYGLKMAIILPFYGTN
ncbi:MAG: hypothetical protein ACPGLV_13965 [Bacteroidia bacterium]